MVFIISAAIIWWLQYFQFHAPNYDVYIVGNVMVLLWIPMLSIMLLFREEPSNFGFCLGDWKKIWPILVVGFIGLAALMVFVSHWKMFQDYYPIFRQWGTDFQPAFAGYPNTNPFTQSPLLMLYAEATYGLYMFCWEYFFRGYMLFGLQRSIGWWAILIQAVGFGLLHYGKPMPEVISSFGAGIILGIIALNAKSFVPCFVLHWASALTFDLLIIASRK